MSDEVTALVQPLGQLKRIEAREVWAHEARDFTPWLHANLELLADALGVGIEPAGAEVPVGVFSVDIVGRTIPDGRVIVVENQLEATDHSHLGQLLTYASGLDSTVIVWLAPQFRDEHRQALDWLNGHTTEGVDFFGVELELLRIDDSAPAVHFKLVAQPNEWAKATRSTVQARQWDEASFMDDLGRRAGAAAVQVARSILAWGTGQGLEVWWGRGKADGSMVPTLRLGGAGHFLFTVWTYGRVEVNFQYMTKGPFADEVRRQALRERLESIAGVNIPVEALNKRPSIRLDLLSQPRALAAFTETFDWAIGEIRTS